MRAYRMVNQRRARSPYRRGQLFYPEMLGLRALYDYRNSTSTTMVDQSGNGRADATVGGGSNSPLWLPYTVPQIYFPGSAGNTVSCTAPANTASYSAQPVGGGAPTTGAASAGAFAFGASNAGAWESVSLLNGSAAELARFQASSSSQTGHTDAYSVAWTVNRSTSGRKTVVQSHAANSARGVWLFGTDDWIDVPAAAVPALNTQASASGLIVVFRRWHNDGTGDPVFATKASLGNAVLGVTLRMATSAASTDMTVIAADGTTHDGSGGVAAVALGLRAVAAVSVGNASPFTSLAINGGTAGTDTSRDTTTTTSTGGAGRLGAFVNNSGPIDMELEALLTRNTPFTTAEIAQAVAFYGGGL